MNIPDSYSTKNVNPQDLVKYEKMRKDKILYFKVLMADLLAEIYKILMARSFSEVDELNSYQKDQPNSQPVLLIIPAIWLGGKDICPQFIDYLDAGAAVWKKLTESKIPVKIFLLGAEHKGEGFYIRKGKNISEHSTKFPLRILPAKMKNFVIWVYAALKKPKYSENFSIRTVVCLLR